LSIPPYPIPEPASASATAPVAGNGTMPPDRPSPTASGGVDHQEPDPDQPDLFGDEGGGSNSEAPSKPRSLRKETDRPRDLNGEDRPRGDAIRPRVPLSLQATSEGRRERLARIFGD